jgi:hypothetical protein
MLSAHFKHLVQQTVQLRLAELVAASSYVTGSSDNCAIKWLCRLAGPAGANSYPAACAVLDKVHVLDDVELVMATGAPSNTAC